MDGEGLRHGTIAIPGQMTSANLMLKLAIGNFDSKEMIFSSIPDAVSSGCSGCGPHNPRGPNLTQEINSIR